MTQLHMSHQGIKRTQGLARESVYWPGINTQIEKLVRACEACQSHQPQQSSEDTLHHHIPPQPWWKLGSDICQIKGRTFLIIIDHYSKYPLVIELRATTSAAIATHFRSVCSMFGSPKVLVSDNGPPYIGEAMKQFTYSWGIEHITSIPHYPKSNGLAERTVGTIKSVITKYIESGADLSICLQHLHATPIDHKTPSPAELLFGRPITTNIPSHAETRAIQWEIRNHLEDRLETKTGNSLNPLYSDQPVRILDLASKIWVPGSVISRTTEP